jgi:hypothetical protein
MARVFAVWVQSFMVITSVAVQTISEAEICQGAESLLRADARFASRSASEGWCPGATTITNLS